MKNSPASLEIKPAWWKRRGSSILLPVALAVAILAGWSAPGRAQARAADAPQADLVVLGGSVVTMANDDHRAEAVAIRNGRVAAVGTDAEIRDWVGARTEVIDARGQMVLPGLYESHVHALRASLHALRDPYAELRSIAEIQDWVRRRAREVPAGEWIRIPRNEITRLREGRHPTVEELDAACRTHPVVFEAVRKYVLNSKGLETVGIARDASSVPGARVMAGPDGRVQLLAQVSPQLAIRWAPRDNFSEDEKRESLLRLHRAYHAAGITSIYERGSDISEYRYYEKLKADGVLSVRTRFALRTPARTGPDLERYLEVQGVQPWQADEWLSVGQIKIMADGGIHWGNTYLSEPYGEERARVYGHADPAYRGDLFYSEAEMASLFASAARLGWQMVVHATGDAGTDAVLAALELADRQVPLAGKRFTLTHAYFPHPEAISRSARLGLCLDSHSVHYYRDSEFIRRVYGLGWAERFMGLGDWLRGGVPLALNADHMVGYDKNTSMNAYNPFLAMYVAVSRRNDAGQVYGARQRISRLEALRAMTLGAAYQAFDETSGGSLEVGKYGDLIVIDRDYLQCPEEEIKDIQVLCTVVAGQVRFRQAGFGETGTVDRKSDR